MVFKSISKIVGKKGYSYVKSSKPSKSIQEIVVNFLDNNGLGLVAKDLRIEFDDSKNLISLFVKSKTFANEIQVVTEQIAEDLRKNNILVNRIRVF